MLAPDPADRPTFSELLHDLARFENKTGGDAGLRADRASKAPPKPGPAPRPRQKRGHGRRKRKRKGKTGH